MSAKEVEGAVADFEALVGEAAASQLREFVQGVLAQQAAAAAAAPAEPGAKRQKKVHPAATMMFVLSLLPRSVHAAANPGSPLSFSVAS